MRNCILLILSGVALLGANRAFAQKIKKDSLAIKDTVKHTKNAILLQKVEITGSTSLSYKSGYSFFGNKTQTAIIDIPQSISTITKELIHDKMEFTLKDVVDDVAGVNQYSGYDEYTIRGFRAENARDINGLRGYNSTYTSSMLVNIERVEVIKGPTATLYGNCDPGGTINLVTKKPLDTGRAELNIYQGSWQHLRAEADLTGPLNKSKTLLYRFNAGYDKTNSFREQNFAKSYELAPSLSYIPNDKLKLNIDFSISHINTVLDRGQPGFMNDQNLLSTPISLTASQTGDYLHETDIASIATISYKISKRLTFNSGYLNYITRQDVAEHGVHSYISNDSVNLYYSTWHYPTVTNTITNYFTYQINSGKINQQLLAGYDYVRSKSDLSQQYDELPDQFGEGSGIVGTFSLKNPQYFKRPAGSYQPSDYDSDASDVDDDVYHTQGIYVQDQLNYKRWKILFSLREEFYKGDETDSAGGLRENIFLPRIGITYALQPNINLYATYNKGFDPFEAATSAQVFDEPFKPITSQLWETGLKGNFFDKKLFASVAIYQLRVQNVAVNANDLSDPNLFVQQGENRSRGFEAEAGGNILPNLSVMASYAYCDARVTKSDIASQIGTTVENAPSSTSGSWIKYTFNKGTIKGLGISIGHSQVGMRNTLDSNITLPGYTIFNGGVHYRYQHFLLAMNVNNLTNKTYWTSAYNNINKWPGAPRNYMVNLGYRF
jgi:iron complex outermembrane receptor protein